MSSILVKVLMKYRNWSAMILAIGWLLHDVLITNDNTIFFLYVSFGKKYVATVLLFSLFAVEVLVSI